MLKVLAPKVYFHGSNKTIISYAAEAFTTGKPNIKLLYKDQVSTRSIQIHERKEEQLDIFDELKSTRMQMYESNRESKDFKLLKQLFRSKPYFEWTEWLTQSAKEENVLQKFTDHFTQSEILDGYLNVTELLEDTVLTLKVDRENKIIPLDVSIDQ